MPRGKKQVEVTKRSPKVSQLNRTTEAITQSTMQLLEEVGYRGLTTHKIATHSGIARSTIYRRWSSIQEIVIFSVKTTIGPFESVPETEDIRLNLLIVYKRLAENLQQSAFGRILPALIEAAAYDAAFHQLLLDFMRPPRLDTILMLQNAKQRGEIRQDIDVNWFLDSIAGPLYFRLLVTRTPLMEAKYIEYLIDSSLAHALTKN